jgi:hypothetical protein
MYEGPHEVVGFQLHVHYLLDLLDLADQGCGPLAVISDHSDELLGSMTVNFLVWQINIFY